MPVSRRKMDVIKMPVSLLAKPAQIQSGAIAPALQNAVATFEEEFTAKMRIRGRATTVRAVACGGNWLGTLWRPVLAGRI